MTQSLQRYNRAKSMALGMEKIIEIHSLAESLSTPSDTHITLTHTLAHTRTMYVWLAAAAVALALLLWPLRGESAHSRSDTDSAYAVYLDRCCCC